MSDLTTEPAFTQSAGRNPILSHTQRTYCRRWTLKTSGRHQSPATLVTLSGYSFFEQSFGRSAESTVRNREWSRLQSVPQVTDRKNAAL